VANDGASTMAARSSDPEPDLTIAEDALRECDGVVDAYTAELRTKEHVFVAVQCRESATRPKFVFVCNGDGALTRIFWADAWRDGRDSMDAIDLTVPSDIDAVFARDALPVVMSLFDRHRNLRVLKFGMYEGELALFVGLTGVGAKPLGEEWFSQFITVRERQVRLKVVHGWIEDTVPGGRLVTSYPLAAGCAIGKSGERGFRTLGGFVGAAYGITAGHKGFCADVTVAQSTESAAELAYVRSVGSDLPSAVYPSHDAFLAFQAKQVSDGLHSWETFLAPTGPFRDVGTVIAGVCGDARVSDVRVGVDVALVHCFAGTDLLNIADRRGTLTVEGIPSSPAGGVVPLDTVLTPGNPVDAVMFAAFSGGRQGYYQPGPSALGAGLTIGTAERTLLPIYMNGGGLFGKPGDSGGLVYEKSTGRLLGMQSANGRLNNVDMSWVAPADVWWGDTETAIRTKLAGLDLVADAVRYPS